MKATIGLLEENAQAVALKLNQLLADEFLLYAKTRNYHWNVEGTNFMEMHKFYESLYEELDTVIDEVAERIRAIGHYAQARLKDYVKATNLEEEEYSTDQKKQLQNLLEDHETIIRYLRTEIEIFTEKI